MRNLIILHRPCQRLRKRVGLFTLLGVLGVTACGGGNGDAGAEGDGAIPDAPDAAVATIMDRLSKQNGAVLWQAMPDSYRSDVNGIVRLAGTKIDPEVYNRGFGLVGRAADIMAKQKGFILGSQFGPKTPEEREKLAEAWPAIVGILATLGDSGLASSEGLRSFEGGEFFSGTVSELLGYTGELSRLTGEGTGLSELGKAEVSVVEAEGDSAVIEVKVPGQPVQKETLSRVEDRWVPADMAKQWDDGVGEMKKQLESVTEEQMTKNKPQVMQMLGMFEGVLSRLEAAESQKAFDQALQGAMMPIMGLMMMGNQGGQGGAAPMPQMPGGGAAPQPQGE